MKIMLERKKINSLYGNEYTIHPVAFTYFTIWISVVVVVVCLTFEIQVNIIEAIYIMFVYIWTNVLWNERKKVARNNVSSSQRVVCIFLWQSVFYMCEKYWFHNRRREAAVNLSSFFFVFLPTIWWKRFPFHIYIQTYDVMVLLNLKENWKYILCRI